jgi:hypothetical protein
MRGFIVGALAGGVAAYLWRDQLNRYLDSRTRGIRTRAAETLKQAGEMVESAGERIAETIEAGQEGPEHARRPLGGLSPLSQASRSARRVQRPGAAGRREGSRCEAAPESRPRGVPLVR